MNWRKEPITEKQADYIQAIQEHSPYTLPVFTGKTKGEAHDYIERYSDYAYENEWAIVNGYD